MKNNVATAGKFVDGVQIRESNYRLSGFGGESYPTEFGDWGIGRRAR
jgi:hypothetical protein